MERRSANKRVTIRRQVGVNSSPTISFQWSAGRSRAKDCGGPGHNRYVLLTAHAQQVCAIIELIPIVIAPLSRTAAQGENGYRKTARRHFTASVSLIPLVNSSTHHRSISLSALWNCIKPFVQNRTNGNIISHRFLALVFEESESVHTGIMNNGVVGGVDGVEDFAMSDKRSVWVVEVKPEEVAAGSVLASVMLKDAS